MLNGRVVGVADGDTVTVLDASRQQHKIRLMGIDAPEKRMPYGNRSKQSLSDLIFDRQVQVEYNKKDRYGRTVGKIIVDGVDANLAQIKAGMAWHYKQYQLCARLVPMSAMRPARKISRLASATSAKTKAR